MSFLADTVQAKFFKLCIFITLFGAYEFIPGLMTLALFQGHRCVRVINCNSFYFRFLSTVVCMLATNIKKINQSILCVTGVYLTNITLFFSILNLNVSRLNICSSSFYFLSFLSFFLSFFFLLFLFLK